MWQRLSPLRPSNPVTPLFLFFGCLFCPTSACWSIKKTKKKTVDFKRKRKKSIWIFILCLFQLCKMLLLTELWETGEKKYAEAAGSAPSRPPHLPGFVSFLVSTWWANKQNLLESTYLFLLITNIHVFSPLSFFFFFPFCFGRECTGGLNFTRRAGGGGLRISFLECILCTSV